MQHPPSRGTPPAGEPARGAERWRDVVESIKTHPNFSGASTLEFTMSKLTTHTTIKVVANRDTGSLPVSSNDLPEAFRENGLKPAPGTLALRQVGSTEVKNVTYVMGSPAKGYHLCAKGSGQFPADGEFEILVEEQEEAVTE